MFFLNKNKKINFCLVLFSLIFLGVIFFVESNVAYADSRCPFGNEDCGFFTKRFDYTVVEKGAEWVKEILYWVFVVFGWFASVAISILSWALHPDHISGKNGLLNLQAIYDMWQFIRDFFNLFFILVLLYIAFTTVFQIQKNFKQMILSLIIAALLVNFSFPISRFVIDATNVPMYFFANQMAAGTDRNSIEKAFGSVLAASQLEGILLPQYKDGLKKGQVNLEDSTIGRLLMAIIFIFMFSISVLVLSIMFVIRLIALVLLVVFSSVGFVAAIIPGMEKYSKMWWDNFWKYALFGPAATLMLLIAVHFFAATGDVNGSTYRSIKNVAGNVAPNESTYLASMVMFSIPIILLWFAIGLGQTMAIAGGATISGYGHKFAGWAGKFATATPALWGGRKWEKFMTTRSGKVGQFTKWLAPTAVYKGYEEWRKDSHEKDRSPVVQAGAEIADAFGRLPFQDRTDMAFKNYAGNISKEQKDIAGISTNSDYVIHELINALNAGDDEKTIAAIQILASQNDFNDMMHDMGRIQNETGMKFGKDGKEPALSEMSSEGAKEAIKQMMLQTGTSPELAAKAMLNIANTAIAAGNVGMAGSAKFDGKEFIIADEENQAYISAVKLQNLETQQRQRTLHHNAIFKETKTEDIKVTDESGKTEIIKMSLGDINGKVGHSVLGTFTSADINQSARSRDDLKREITNRMKVLKYGTKADQDRLQNMQEEMNNNPIISEYFKRVYAMTSGRDYDSGAEVDSEKFKPISKGGEKSDFSTLASKSYKPSK